MTRVKIMSYRPNPVENPRRCFVCHAPTSACMGFVIARDMLPFLTEPLQRSINFGQGNCAASAACAISTTLRGN
jgi:hypothetical protein